MAEEALAQNAGDFDDQVLATLLAILKDSTSPEFMRTQQILAQRLALTGSVIPSRIPAPKNITEIGGYLNLLEKLNETELRSQSLASILGVAGPNPPAGLLPTQPVIFFATRQNDRPAVAQQPTIPVQFTMRSDFIAAFDGALKEIRDRGCALPILSPVRSLSQFNSAASSTEKDFLKAIGRTLELMPTTALIDPDADALALARLAAGGDQQVVARQLDASAPKAGEVTAESWIAWKCDNSSCSETTADRTYLPLNPMLNAAGWHQSATPDDPTSLREPGNWFRWTNVTGLVPGVTRFGDELRLLYTEAEIVASPLREELDKVWDGTTFNA
jgi:hypothetical protein